MRMPTNKQISYLTNIAEKHGNDAIFEAEQLLGIERTLDFQNHLSIDDASLLISYFHETAPSITREQISYLQNAEATLGRRKIDAISRLISIYYDEFEDLSVSDASKLIAEVSRELEETWSEGVHAFDRDWQ